jgi:DNA-3-methyladenine glycosylase II
MFTDKILLDLVAKYPAPQWSDRSKYLFENLIETIISQQLSGKAAETIFNRFKSHFNPTTFPTPAQVLAVSPEQLRSLGISTAKSNYIHNVAQAFIDKKITIETVQVMSDEEIITTLTQIKGLGKWSAEMILIFTLNRPDIFSFGDLGLRNAIKNLYGISAKEEILKLTETWSPNRSLASWYLWRSLEN